MNRQHATGSPNDFRRVASIKATLPEFVRREYQQELKPLIKELNALLPRLKKRVSSEFYAIERDELMLLTVCFYDDTLDIYGLEALVRQLKGHRQIFVAALAETTSSVMKKERFGLCCNKTGYVKAYMIMTLTKVRARNAELFKVRSTYRWRPA